jgi:hypothetical protein
LFKEELIENRLFAGARSAEFTILGIIALIATVRN